MPSFGAFGRFLETVNPFAFWAQAAQMAWLPWIEATRTNPLAPRVTANSHIPPAATAIFETNNFLTLVYGFGQLLDLGFETQYFVVQISIGHADMLPDLHHQPTRISTFPKCCADCR